MYRCALAAAMLAALPLAAPSYAVTAREFGADEQHLQGKPRDAFMKKCMSNADEPRGAGAPGAPPAQH